MDRTPAPLSAIAEHFGGAAALGRLQRASGGNLRFAARPTSGPQVPHARDEFYVVASGTARYRWDGGEAMIGPGDMMFAAAHTPHGYDQFSEDFSVWVVFYGPEK